MSVIRISTTVTLYTCRVWRILESSSWITISWNQFSIAIAQKYLQLKDKFHSHLNLALKSLNIFKIISLPEFIIETSDATTNSAHFELFKNISTYHNKDVEELQKGNELQSLVKLTELGSNLKFQLHTYHNLQLNILYYNKPVRLSFEHLQISINILWFEKMIIIKGNYFLKKPWPNTYMYICLNQMKMRIS